MQDAPNDILSLALLYRDALESEEGVGSLPQLLVQRAGGDPAGAYELAA
jgi:hypothetical protein